MTRLFARAFAIALTSLAAMGCPDDPTSPEPSFPTDGTCLATEQRPLVANWALERVFEDELVGESSKLLVSVAAIPGTPGRWLAASQNGKVFAFDVGGGPATEVLDIGDRMWTEHHEVGVLGATPHPEFASNGQLFIVYTSPPTEDGATFMGRVSRFTSSDGLFFDPESEVVILEVAQDYPVHNVNHVAFGPDGYMYVGLGDDAGSPARPQDPNSLYGSILRVDVDGGTPYAIPPDNPYVDGGAPEVFAKGLRNPWRFSFDRESGELWVGDVGQNRYEEINVVESAGNYGWPIMEGTDCYQADSCESEGLEPPVWAYGHSEGRSVTGGFVYRGGELPQLTGSYVWADYIAGNLWRLWTDDDGEVQASLIVEAGLALTTMSETPEGELLAVHYSGEAGGVYKLVAAEAGAVEFPQRLSATGCFDADDPRVPGERLVAYEIAATLWSDGATKERFVSVPDGSAVAVDAAGDFEFPLGTVLVKHFKVGERFHETRLLMHHADGWAGYSYEWNDEQTDAVLLKGGKTVILPSGLRWQYPTGSQCVTCHTEAVKRVLGPEMRQLQRQGPAGNERGEQTADQLQWWIDHGMFGEEVTSREDLPDVAAMPSPKDESAPIEDRARAYLHANCSGCHREGGTSHSGAADMRYELSLAETGMCNGEPESGTPWYLPGSESMKIIVPGEPDQSLVAHRMETLTRLRMPPLASSVPDEEGIAVVREWIESLTGCP